MQTFFRSTSRNVPVVGGTIPDGSELILFIAAAYRDPRHWERAAGFDITRSDRGHVGFGFGIHQCIGQMVARLEAQALLKPIIPPVREIRLAGTPVRWLNNTLHALASLPIELAGN
ncbi:MAG: cytochrome P450 [Sphingomonadaceae bacterium]